MEGFLECKIGLYTFKYYFILHDSILMYCKKQSSRIIGQIHLSIANIQQREYSINISTGIEKIILIFDNTEQKNVWFDCLSKQNQKLHIEDELEKVRSLQYQFENTLKLVSKTIEKNPNLNSYSEKVSSLGFTFSERLNELVDFLYQQAQPEFQSCQSINSFHTASLKPAPHVRKAVQLGQQQFNIWIVKNELQKPYYEMKIPIYVYLPCTMLQLIATQMKYVHILDRASQIRDQELKIALIIGFIVSQYSSLKIQLPLPSKINETFEVVETYKYLSQQINENLVAFYSTSSNFDYNGSVEYLFQFEQLRFDVQLNKKMLITLKKNSDTYTITSENHYISIRNLVSQRPEISLEGKFIISYKGNIYEVKFQNNQISSQIGTLKISGQTGKLIAVNIYNEELILFQQDEKEFDFNKHNPLLPPSDSRFRDDLIKMQEGNYIEAQKVQDMNEQFSQVWFNKENIYKGGYFTHQTLSQG